jgi:hypothetical protein
MRFSIRIRSCTRNSRSRCGRFAADMRALRTGDGRLLPPQLVAELNRLRRRLSFTLEMIRELDVISTVTDAVLETVAEWQNPAFGDELSADFLRRHPGQDPR